MYVSKSWSKDAKNKGKRQIYKCSPSWLKKPRCNQIGCNCKFLSFKIFFYIFVLKAEYLRPILPLFFLCLESILPFISIPAIIMLFALLSFAQNLYFFARAYCLIKKMRIFSLYIIHSCFRYSSRLLINANCAPAFKNLFVFPHDLILKIEFRA